MRRRAIVLSVLSSTAVLAAGYQIGAQAHEVASVIEPDAAATTSAAQAPSAGPAPTAAASATTPAAPPPAGASGTFSGTSVSTRYGNVQVQITVENGTLTDVTAVKLTDDGQRSVSISNRAAPVLRREVLAAQSAAVQGVSGATYTSDAYLSSLQSALDQAGL